MNEPIVSPWLIYWIGRVNILQGISCVFGIFLTVGAILLTIMQLTDDYKKDEPFPKLFKVLIGIALMFDTLALFVPTKTEIVAMYAARYVTPTNIKATGEFADKAVDKLIEKILKASEAAKEK